MKATTLLLIYSTILIAHSAICNTAAFGGGGSYGAHSAGAFSAFVSLLPQSSINYTAVAGISAGSLNSIGIAQFPTNSEQGASEFILSVWRSINGSQSIFEEWTGGLVAGLLFHSGLYDTAPEFKLLKQQATKPAQRKLSMGTVEINSGLYRIYNETYTLTQQQQAAMCSSAIPALFKNQDFNGGVYCDGGLFNGFDAVEAIERCLEGGSAQSEIYLDIFSCFSYNLTAEAAKMKTIQVIERSFSIRGRMLGFRSLNFAKQAYPNVNYRYFVEPLETFSGSALDFNATFINELIGFGIQDAKKIIGAGINLEKAIKENKPVIIYP